jgi:hypothetical protein
MKLYLNLGHIPEAGSSIGRDLLDALADLGFHGIRQDLPDDHDLCRQILEELASYHRLHPLFLVAGGRMTRGHPGTGAAPWTREALRRHVEDVCSKLDELEYFERPDPPALEIGNEPDIAVEVWKDHPKLLGETFAECYSTVREFTDRSVVLTPSVSNLNQRGITYLGRMLARGLPAGAAVAVHRYPNGRDSAKAHPGFETRDRELEELFRLVGGADVWVTETGRTEGPERIRRFPLPDLTIRMTEEEVSDFVEEELRFWAAVPQVRAVVWYQLNSGPDDEDPMHHYGIRRHDGTFKPVARRLSALIEELA